MTLKPRKLRNRLARWLVGPFVTIPDRSGVWVVQRFGPDSHMVFEADKYRLRTGIDITRDGITGLSISALERLGAARRWGRFVGTVKS